MSAPSTDPALWAVRPVFGHAGGPDEVVLTAEGNARAFAVGAQVKQGPASAALEALDAAGGAALLLARLCNRLIHTDLGRRFCSVEAWGRLRALGYVHNTYSSAGVGVGLTEEGRNAVKRGHAERACLLERCKRAAAASKAEG